MLNPTTPKCEQCNMYHPPLKPGEICPLKKPDPSDVDLGSFLITLNQTLISNIEKKNIKNIEEFKKYIIVSLTKKIEEYIEK